MRLKKKTCRSCSSSSSTPSHIAIIVIGSKKPKEIESEVDKIDKEMMTIYAFRKDKM